MDNNRSEILAQLASGQISADQAAEQLRGPAAPDPAPTAGPTPPPTPLTPEQNAALANHWLRIRVSDLQSGRQKVAVNLPLTWLSVGLRLGARFSPEVAGLDANELLALLQSSGAGQVIDVEDSQDGEHVQIFIE